MKTISTFGISLILTGAAWLVPAFSQAPAPPAPAPQPAPAARAKAARHAVVVTRSGSYLGVGAIDIDEERAKALNLKEVRGVEIKSVDADSPASKAGLKEGDVVLEFNGQPVQGIEQFSRLVRETPSGRQVRLTVWRGGATQNLTAAIATRPGVTWRDGGDYTVTIPPIPPIPPIEFPQIMTNWRNSTLGVETETLTPQLAEFFGVKEGVLVRSVSRNSAAEKAGIKAGDVIVKVDDRKVSNAREISSALFRLASRQTRTFPVVVVRKQQETTLSVTLEERRGMRWTFPVEAAPHHC